MKRAKQQITKELLRFGSRGQMELRIRKNTNNRVVL